MSLPENRVSDDPIITSFLSPDNKGFNPLVAFERGGVDIQDPSEGLSGYEWRARFVSGTIKLEQDPLRYYDFITDLPNDVLSIDFTFDQNMNPVVTWELEESSFIYWFDPVVQDYVTSEFFGIRNPRLTLDDKRTEFVDTSDVIFAYLRDDVLAYRQQRDRFLIERGLSSGIPENLVLEKIGMQTNHRLLFQIEQEKLLPECGTGLESL